ncbi:hypothetical protein KKA94_03370 [Patescibacteria group bacterium]|nr:hypothetical protein [Patescibacteria group bacterium]
MQYYKTHAGKLAGTHHERLMKKAFDQYKEIAHKSKRRPYIRSAYYDKEKIFLSIFWQHLHEKNLRDKARRLALFPCAIELMEKTRYSPTTKANPNKKGELLHRFAGSTPDNEIFFVQIKEDKQTKQKYFISVFPLDI